MKRQSTIQSLNLMKSRLRILSILSGTPFILISSLPKINGKVGQNTSRNSNNSSYRVLQNNRYKIAEYFKDSVHNSRERNSKSILTINSKNTDVNHGVTLDQPSRFHELRHSVQSRSIRNCRTNSKKSFVQKHQNLTSRNNQ